MWGGRRFSTSRQTLTQVQDTFFTGLLSGRIQTLKDEQGAIFIDRDPELFRLIINFLRNRSLAFKDLRHEAEFYGISPLVKKLSLCEDLDRSGCGDVLFCSYLAPQNIPPHEAPPTTKPNISQSEGPAMFSVLTP